MNECKHWYLTLVSGKEMRQSLSWQIFGNYIQDEKPKRAHKKVLKSLATQLGEAPANASTQRNLVRSTLRIRPQGKIVLEPTVDGSQVVSSYADRFDRDTKFRNQQADFGRGRILMQHQTSAKGDQNFPDDPPVPTEILWLNATDTLHIQDPDLAIEHRQASGEDFSAEAQTALKERTWKQPDQEMRNAWAEYLRTRGSELLRTQDASAGPPGPVPQGAGPPGPAEILDAGDQRGHKTARREDGKGATGSAGSTDVAPQNVATHLDPPPRPTFAESRPKWAEGAARRAEGIEAKRQRRE